MAPLSDPHEGRGRAILGAFVFLIILPPVFVALRVWARRLKKTPLCFNDYTIVGAMFFACGYDVNGGIITAVKGGQGQHTLSLSTAELTVFAKATLAHTLLWPTANTLVKVSVLHFYTKVFSTRTLARYAYALGALTLAYWLSTVVTAFSICRPLAYNWDKHTIKGHCGDVSAYYLSTAIINLLIDVAIVALPLPLLWSLQMKTSRKVALTGIFSLGTIICIVSIVRIISIKELNINSNSDVTYDIVLDNFCSALEPTLGVVNACLPLLQPVVSKVSDSTMIAWSKLRLTGGTSRGRFSSQGAPFEPSVEPISRRFRRIPGDVYPLTDITTTQCHCSGPGRQAASDTDTETFKPDFDNNRGIEVKHYVGVESRANHRS